jgi:hypothetical protein
MVDSRESDQAVDNGKRQPVNIWHPVKRRRVMDFLIAQIGCPAIDALHHIKGLADDRRIVANPVADGMRHIGVPKRRQDAGLPHHPAFRTWRRDRWRAAQHHLSFAAIKCQHDIRLPAGQH